MAGIDIKKAFYLIIAMAFFSTVLLKIATDDTAQTNHKAYYTGKNNELPRIAGGSKRHEVKGYFMEDYKSDQILHVIPSPGKTKIAIGCAITTKKSEGIDNLSTFDVKKLIFFQVLLESFCETASPGYIYNFYISHDNNDTFLSRTGSHFKFKTAFNSIIETKCKPNNITKVNLNFVNCTHSHSPAWAQNDAMMQGFMEGNDFFYRITDDARLTSNGWTDIYIKRLAKFKPPFVGVVGPSNRGGNVEVLTFDFTHRTHIDIFGFYYPRVFTDWFADGWITQIYKPDRSVKVKYVTLYHTRTLGQRYSANRTLVKYKIPEVEKGAQLIQKYVEAVNKIENITAKTSNITKVVALSLYGNNSKYTFGAIRNAQLIKIFFPLWSLRVYVSNSSEYRIPDNVLEILRRLKTQIVWVDTKIIDICPSLWRYLVIDDESVDFFLIRNAVTRLSEREASAVRQWEKTRKPFYCIRDHQKHEKLSIVPGLWGGIPKEIRNLLDNDMIGMMRTSSGNDMCNRINTWITDILWPKVKDNLFCHDSITCRKYPNSHKFPESRTELEYIGQEYDIHEVPVKEENVSDVDCDP